jgi:hypothetical protein
VRQSWKDGSHMTSAAEPLIGSSIRSAMAAAACRTIGGMTMTRRKEAQDVPDGLVPVLLRAAQVEPVAAGC